MGTSESTIQLVKIANWLDNQNDFTEPHNTTKLIIAVNGHIKFNYLYYSGTFKNNLSDKLEVVYSAIDKFYYHPKKYTSVVGLIVYRKKKIIYHQFIHVYPQYNYYAIFRYNTIKNTTNRCTIEEDLPA